MDPFSNEQQERSRRLDQYQRRGCFKECSPRHKHRTLGKEVETQSETGESSGQHKNGVKSWKKEGKKFDKIKIKCFNCNKYGHFASECTHKHKEGRNKAGDEANLAEGAASDSEQVLLMVIEKSDKRGSEFWYLDTGCSNHMTGNKH